MSAALERWADWTLDFRIERVGVRGHGVFAVHYFDSSDVLGQYVGELLPMNSVNSRSSYNAALSIGKYDSNFNRQQKCFIDSANMGSVFRFLNHSCEPNAELLERKCGKRSGRILVVVVTRDIEAGEEVTINYGDDYFGEDCLCRPCSD